MAKKKVEKKSTKKDARPEQLKNAARTGRRKGVRKYVTEQYKEIIRDFSSGILADCTKLERNVESFLEKGNQSAAKEARANLQDMILSGKALRKVVQEAKLNMEEVNIDS